MADLLLGVKIGVQGGPQSVKEIKAIDDQVRKLQEQNARVAATAKALSQAYDLSDAEVGQLVSELQKLENQTKGVTREARSLDSVFQGLLQGFGQQLTQIGFQAFTGSVRGIKDAIGGSISSFIEFEGALRQAGAISGSLGTQEFQNLSDEIDRLGIVTSKTPQEIANTAVSLAKAGFSAGELTQAMEGITRASEATGESLELVGDIIAKTLRMFSLEASETSRVANVLVQTANSTNSSVAGLGESLKYVGPTAKSANQSIESTAVVLGLLGDAGIQGSQAGTNYAAGLDSLKLASAGANSEFSSLVKGNKKATAAFNVISASVRDADGGMKDILDIIPELKAGLANLGKGDQDLVLKALFGVEGRRAFETILNTSAERVQKVTEEVRVLSQIGEGAAVKTGKALLEGLKGSFDLIGGSIGSLQKELGKAFEPGLEGAIRLVTDVINKVLDAGDAFTAISDAGERFTETLQANPQLAAQLADAFTQIAQVLSQGIADQLDRLTVALQSNPDLVRNLAQSLVTAAQQAGLFVSQLINVAATVGTIGASFAGAAGSIFTSIAPTLTALVNVINSVVQALQPLLANTELVEVAFQALVLQMLAVRAASLASSFASLAGGLVSLVRGVVSATAAMAAFNTAQATGSKSALLLGQSLAGNAATATASAKGFAQAAATSVRAGAQIALLAAAIASVSTALSRFKDGGAEFNEAADDIRGSLVKAQIELKKTADQSNITSKELSELFPAQPPPTDFLDRVTEKLVEIRGRIDEVIGRVPGLRQALALVPGVLPALSLLPDTTNAEKQVNDLKVGLDNLIKASDEVITSNESFAGSQSQAATQVNTFSAAIERLRDEQQALDPAKLGTDAYQQFTNTIENQIGALERERREFQQRFGLIDNFDDLAKKNATTLDEIALKSEQTIQDLKDKGSPQQEILNVEKKALEDRLKENKRFSLQLKNAIEAGILDPQQVKQANDEILRSEQNIVTLREQIRDKESQIAQSIRDATAAAAASQQASLEDLTAGNQQALNKLEVQAAQAQEALIKSGGDPAKLAQAEKTSLEQRIAENKKFLENLKGLKGLEGDEAAKVADQIRQTELTLANDRVALARQVLDAKVKAAEEAAKKEVDALKIARDAEKETATTEFRGQQETRQEQFNKQERGRQKAFNEQQRKAEEIFNDQQEDDQKAFNETQRQAEEAFQKRQQAESKRFQAELDARRERGNREFDALGKEVDRRLQLQQASGSERAELRKQLQEEDKAARERRKIEQQVLNDRGRVLAGQGDLLELSPLEQARQQFEQSLQAEQEAFQLKQQEAQTVFRKLQEGEQDIFREAQEDQQEIFRKAQETESEKFEERQRELEKAFTKSQQASEAEFNRQQRQLDEASAQRQAAILEAASRGIAPQVQARKDGGPVAAGQAYLVGEQGPELITPSRKGWVHTASETAALLGKQPTMLMKNPAMPGIEAKLSELLQEVKRGRRVAVPTSYTLNTVNPLEDAISLQIKQVRALARGRVL